MTKFISKNRNRQYFKIFTFFNIVFLQLVVFINVPLGFDVYSHVIEVVSLRNNQHEIEAFININVPRYLLLSYIYKVSNNLGIGVIPVAFILTLIPSVMLISSINKKSFYPVSLLVILWATAFYSASGLSVLYFLTYLKTRKFIFLVGLLFSPLGCVIFLVTIVFISMKRIYNNIFDDKFTYRKIFHSLFQLFILTSTSYIVILFYKQINFIIEVKIIEVSVIVSAVFLIYITKNVLFQQHYIKLCLVSLSLFICPSFIFLHSIYFYDKINLANFLLGSSNLSIVAYGLHGGVSHSSFENLFWLRARND